MPLHFRLSDLSPSQQAQVMRQIDPQRKKPSGQSPSHSFSGQSRTAAASSKSASPVPSPSAGSPLATISETPYAPSSVTRPPVRDSRDEPNATERDYNVRVLGGRGRYEAVALRMPGGNYTPDFMTIDDGTVTFHEVKGSYRFGSESRAVLAFREAAALFPFWRFVWAQKQKDGSWKVRRAVNDPDDTPPTPTPSSTPLPSPQTHTSVTSRETN